MNRLESAGYNALMDDIRIGDFYDPWGLAMGWCFALAEVAYVEYNEILPGFEPSPVLENRSDIEGYEVEILLEMIDDGVVDQADIERIYQIMSRYADWVKLAGRNY